MLGTGEAVCVTERVRSGTLLDLAGDDESVRRRLARIQESFVAPARLAVTGRAGSGRGALVRALAARLTLDAVAMPATDPRLAEADAVVYVLGGTVRAEDAAALAGLGGPPVTVVLGKADARTLPGEPGQRAEAAAQRLGVPVLPVSGLLGAAVITDDDVALARSVAGVGAAVGGDAAPLETSDLIEPSDLIARVGLAGWRRVLDLTRGGAAAADITAALHEASGIGALGGPVRAALAEGSRRRGELLRSALSAVAAAGDARAAIEAALRC